LGRHSRRRGRALLLRRIFRRRRRRNIRFLSRLPEARDDGVDRHGLALGHEDFEEGAGSRGWNLGVDLVGGDLEERLVALDRVAGLLEPLRDRSFGDRLAHLRHDDVRRHGLVSGS
jgi:hypothetical protein